MRQIWISKAGPPEVFVVKEEAPDPQPTSDEIRIRVEASGVNFADVMGRMGLYPDLPPIPVVPGYEVAGRVDAVGGGVDPSWVGDEVFALTRFGGYSDVVCVPHAQVFTRPPNMSAQEGASITSGRGVELILDAVGGDSLKKSYRVLAPTGRLAVFGASSAATSKREVWSGLNAREHALASVQSLVFDERKQGRLRRQSGTHVGRSDGLGRSADVPVKAGRD